MKLKYSEYALPAMWVVLIAMSCVPDRTLRVKELATRSLCYPLDSTLSVRGTLSSDQVNVRIPFTNRSVRKLIDHVDTSFWIYAIVPDTTQLGNRVLRVRRALGPLPLVGVVVISEEENSNRMEE
jgi:hypothetical protein